MSWLLSCSHVFRGIEVVRSYNIVVHQQLVEQRVYVCVSQAHWHVVVAHVRHYCRMQFRQRQGHEAPMVRQVELAENREQIVGLELYHGLLRRRQRGHVYEELVPVRRPYEHHDQQRDNAVYAQLYVLLVDTMADTGAVRRYGILLAQYLDREIDVALLSGGAAGQRVQQRAVAVDSAVAGVCSFDAYPVGQSRKRHGRQRRG